MAKQYFQGVIEFRHKGEKESFKHYFETQDKPLYKALQSKGKLSIIAKVWSPDKRSKKSIDDCLQHEKTLKFIKTFMATRRAGSRSAAKHKFSLGPSLID